MVRVRSRGGANPSALRFRKLSTGSTDIRLIVAHVARFSIFPLLLHFLSTLYEIKAKHSRYQQKIELEIFMQNVM